MTGSGKTFTIANVINKLQKPTLIMSHNKTLFAQFTESLNSYFPITLSSILYLIMTIINRSILTVTDTFIEKESSVNEEIR